MSVESLGPPEDDEFREYLQEMRALGRQIVGLDERIEEIRAEVVRSGQINAALKRIRGSESALRGVQPRTRTHLHRASWVKTLPPGFGWVEDPDGGLLTVMVRVSDD